MYTQIFCLIDVCAPQGPPSVLFNKCAFECIERDTRKNSRYWCFMRVLIFQFSRCRWYLKMKYHKISNKTRFKCELFLLHKGTLLAGFNCFYPSKSYLRNQPCIILLFNVLNTWLRKNNDFRYEQCIKHAYTSRSQWCWCQKCTKLLSRWWFQMFFVYTPREMIQFD